MLQQVANDVLRNDVGLRPMKLRFAQTELDRSLGFDSEVFRNIIDAFQAFWVCRQIRTATHFPDPFKNPSRSKFIYKAIDAKKFWTDLN